MSSRDPLSAKTLPVTYKVAMSLVEIFPGVMPSLTPQKSHRPYCTEVTNELPRTACHSPFVILTHVSFSSIDSLGTNLVAPRIS